MTKNDFKPYIGEPDVERLIRAMKRQSVDRVPNQEVLIEDPIVEKILGKFAGNTMAYGGDPARGVTENIQPMKPDDNIELCNIIGQDSIIIGTSVWPPYRHEDEKGRLVRIADKSVKSIEDFRKLVRPGKKDIDEIVGHVKKCKEAVKGTKIGVTTIIGGIFIYSYEFLVGMSEFMMACYENRSFVEEIMEDVTEWCVELSNAVIEAGVDYCFFYEDGGFKTGLFLPLKLMQEIWVPRMARIVETATNNNKAVFFHSCGNVTDLFEDFIDIGIDCINPLDPSGMDYRDLKKRFGGRVCLAGNYDVDLLANGTPEAIAKDVKEHMDVLKKGNGYIAASSHSITNDIPFDNFVAMINSIHEYGQY